MDYQNIALCLSWTLTNEQKTYWHLLCSVRVCIFKIVYYLKLFEVSMLWPLCVEYFFPFWNTLTSPNSPQDGNVWPNLLTWSHERFLLLLPSFFLFLFPPSVFLSFLLSLSCFCLFFSFFFATSGHWSCLFQLHVSALLEKVESVWIDISLWCAVRFRWDTLIFCWG